MIHQLSYLIRHDSSWYCIKGRDAAAGWCETCRPPISYYAQPGFARVCQVRQVMLVLRFTFSFVHPFFVDHLQIALHRILTIPPFRGSHHFPIISSHLARQLCEVVSGSDVGLASPDYAAKLRQYAPEHVDPDLQLRGKAPFLLVEFSPASA